MFGAETNVNDGPTAPEQGCRTPVDHRREQGQMGTDASGSRPSGDGLRKDAHAPGGDGPAPVLAVDTGGTFTDLLLLEAGRISALKVPSTPDDPAAAVLAGIEQIFGRRKPTGYRLILGSTVATNTLLERSGARVLLVTNRGFEDVIEIGRQNRPQLYALTGHRQPPLVARDDRIGIAGRLDHRGLELVGVDAGELAELPARVRGAEAVAVALLHSYANPGHERAVGEALSGIRAPVALSSTVLPEFREYERASTTVANAYVAPRVGRYLTRLEDACEADTVRVMGSNGGALAIGRSRDEPVHTVLSGPAGGVVGAIDWARRSGLARVISFDMGGTSTDVSLIPGSPLHTREGSVGGIPIAVPLLDIHTVGAGGGSIASLDPAGALRVGPESAGARPGPVSYGHGGERITVTDAHVWLGRLPDSRKLSRAARLKRAALDRPMTSLAKAAGLSPDELAEGILRVANSAMERALRVISVERGVDPADYHLVAFGGAAGLHAVELAGSLGLKGVLVPPHPGLLSAYGMLVAPVVRERARTVLISSEDPGADRQLRSILEALEEEALGEMLEDGADPARLSAQHRIDARYRGQSFELTVPARGWIQSFHRAHEERYGYRRRSPVEAVTLRARIEGPGEAVRLPEIPASTEGPVPVADRGGVRADGADLDVPVYERSDLAAGSSLAGPAIVAEYSATTWCPPGWRVESDRRGVLLLQPSTAARARPSRARRFS